MRLTSNKTCYIMRFKSYVHINYDSINKFTLKLVLQIEL